jgi:hypothetical protein
MAPIAVTTEMKFAGPKLVAPRWHTALLIALFLGLTLAGAFFQRAERSEDCSIALIWCRCTCPSSPWSGASFFMFGKAACAGAELSYAT